MTEKPSYIELAETLARHVYDNHYKLQERINSSPVRIFDDLFMSSFQIPAGVLLKLKILQFVNGNGEFIEDGMRIYKFCCKPSEFKTVIGCNIRNGCSFDTVVLAVICLIEFDGPHNTNLLEMLARLDVCKPSLKQSPKKKSGFGMLQTANEILVETVDWTEKKNHYDELFENWPALIA